MLTIAGVTVQLGDQLYSNRAGAYGTVIYVQENIATLRVQRAQGHRDFTVEQGGVVAGTRDVFWHAPLQLDLPKGQTAKRAQIEAVVATLVGVL